jgi:phospholipase/lecithinase/hemolysin
MLIDHRGTTNWRRYRQAALLLMAGWLVGCGGGTSQIDPFQPRQIIILGDENAGLTADAKNYAVNGVDATSGVINCSSQPIWTQNLAANFGLALDRCTQAAPADVRGITRAAFNAKAADLDAQIDAQLALGPTTSKDLYVVMVGMHDIVELYETFPGSRDCNIDTRVTTDLEAELSARGHHVAEQINRLVAAGARIIVSTVHDIGLTPYARAKEAAAPGTMALLTCMTAAFNSRVRVDIVQDGRSIGLVLADDQTQAAVKFPTTFTSTDSVSGVQGTLVNVTDAACTVAPPNCTTSTLVVGANAANFLWADDLHFGQAMHTRLSALAETRARNNPF